MNIDIPISVIIYVIVCSGGERYSRKTAPIHESNSLEPATLASMKFIRAASALFLGLGLVHGGIATCTVPTTSYTTLPKLFSINVLAGKDSFNVYLLPGHVDSNTYNKPL